MAAQRQPWRQVTGTAACKRGFPQLTRTEVVVSRDSIACHTFSTEMSSAVTNVVARFSDLASLSWACPGIEGLWATFGPLPMSAYPWSLLLLSVHGGIL